MIKYLKNSNICNVREGIILHGCNAQGVMGSGVAKQLRALYPEIYTQYVRDIYSWGRPSSNALGHTSRCQVSDDLWIHSGITQNYYGKDGSMYITYGAIDDVIANALSDANYYELEVHIPYMIGAGLGGGNLDEITKIIQNQSKMYEIDVICHVLN